MFTLLGMRPRCMELPERNCCPLLATRPPMTCTTTSPVRPASSRSRSFLFFNRRIINLQWSCLGIKTLYRGRRWDTSGWGTGWYIPVAISGKTVLLILNTYYFNACVLKIKTVLDNHYNSTITIFFNCRSIKTNIKIFLSKTFIMVFF